MTESPDPPAQLTVGDFAPLVGESFAVDAGNAGTVELKLLDASAVPAQNAPREPFVLTFQGPAEPALAQQTLSLVHPSLELVVFVVPIARDESGTTYEAVFA